MKAAVTGVGALLVAGVLASGVVMQQDNTPVSAVESGVAQVCGNSAILDGPTVAPDGAITVPAGDNSGFNFRQAGKTFYLEPGVHTLGGGQYSQIIPADNATYIGAPGAIIDGQGVNRFAFTGQASNVTIKHLWIRQFATPSQQGMVNTDSGNGWTIERNVLARSDAAAMMAGDSQVIRNNCIRDNGQYGLNAYQAASGGPENLVLEGNEWARNAVFGEPFAGCGCSGAMKLWSVDGADIRDNWIHDTNGVAIWADNNNNDFLIENNLIEGNKSFGIFYEQSYNALIQKNTLRDNAWGTGSDFASRGDGFPIGAVYVSESGGDSRVPARYDTVEFTDNLFENNWGGVVLWENADRFCNSPANTGSDCTLPMGGTQGRNAECSQPGIATDPLWTDCRWWTKDVHIKGNTFTLDPAAVDGYSSAFSGYSAVFSNWGTYPNWSPYKADVIQRIITLEHGNEWSNNTYSGPFKFKAWDTGRKLSWAQWTSGPYNQDAGSTLNSTPAPTTDPTTDPTTTDAPTTEPSTTEPTPTTDPSDNCTDPVWTTSDRNAMNSFNGYIVHNNVWNSNAPSSTRQTISVCSEKSWHVDASGFPNNNGEVFSYPNSHIDYEVDWGAGGIATGRRLSEFPALNGTFAGKGPEEGSYNVSFDIWLNKVGWTCGATEVMIWTETRGASAQPLGSVVDTYSQEGRTYDVWHYNDGCMNVVSFKDRADNLGDSIDLKALLTWADQRNLIYDRGSVTHDPRIGQIDYGIEFRYTPGTSRFTLTDFSVSEDSTVPTTEPTTTEPTTEPPVTSDPTEPPVTTPPTPAVKLVCPVVKDPVGGQKITCVFRK